MPKDQTQQPTLKIEFTNHGRTFTATLPFDASLPEITLAFANILAASGWSRELIAELMTDGEQNVWEWDV